MQAVVVHPGSIEEATASPAAAAEVAAADEVILPSKSLTPAERVDIYHGMYLLRMEEALATDYPALKHFLGDRGFYQLVRDYVQVYPSRSYTLNRLSDHMPEFLKNARGRKHQEFLVDMARLELAVTEVFDEQETAPLSEARITQVAPDEWERAVLKPIAAFRLLDVRHNVNDYAQSLKDEAHEHPKPRLKQAWLAIYRRNYAVFRLELSRAAYDLLSDLVSGEALGAALEAALGRDARRRPHPDQLSRWFRDWVAAGIFASLEIRRA
jgi:hypothetical protein